MMSTEDRVRAATRARADLVRDIRPLHLPDELARPGPGRRWVGWAAPLAAAAVVLAIVLSQVLIHQAVHPSPAPVTGTETVPRYYVSLASPKATVPGKLVTQPLHAVVGDDKTGRTLAVVDPPAGQTFSGVTAAADDRTFVIDSYLSARQENVWYLLRVTPGAARPARLTRLPVTQPRGTGVLGMALSADGSKLAVIQSTVQQYRLEVYSVSSGTELSHWTTSALESTALANVPYEPSEGANGFELSWAADGEHLAFQNYNDGHGPGYDVIQVRVLDVTAAGHDLIADSRLILHEPLFTFQGSASIQPCSDSLVTPDGGTVVCGASDFAAAHPGAPCAGQSPSFASYSTATGKRLKTLYREAGHCTTNDSVPLWSDSAARRVLVLMVISPVERPARYEFGLIAGGRFTPLPALAVSPVTQTFLSDPGKVAF